MIIEFCVEVPIKPDFDVNGRDGCVHCRWPVSTAIFR